MQYDQFNRLQSPIDKISSTDGNADVTPNTQQSDIANLHLHHNENRNIRPFKVKQMHIRSVHRRVSDIQQHAPEIMHKIQNGIFL